MQLIYYISIQINRESPHQKFTIQRITTIQIIVIGNTN
jgi:hypothetical protein